MKKEITAPAYNALMKITHATKMDCWFDLRASEDIGDYVYDLEEGSTMPLKKGLEMLADGFVQPLDDPFYRLNEKEFDEVLDLFMSYDIPVPISI